MINKKLLMGLVLDITLSISPLLALASGLVRL